MRSLTSTCVSLLLIAASPILAQVRESVTVNFVEVPVMVVDKEGNPVRGLTAANFEVTDEGKKRTVSSFDAIDFSSRASMSAVSPLNPAARRNYLLLFDLSFSSPNTLVRAQRAASDFVDKLVQPRDRIAVASIDADRGYRLLTAFTTDRVLIREAISSPSSFRGSDPLQIAGRHVDLETRAAKTEEAGGGDRPSAAEREETANESIRLASRNDDQFRRQKIERQVSLLAGLAKTLHAVAGQKHVVFLSEGFDPRLVQGRDARSSEEARNESTAVEHGEIWNVDSDQRYGSATSLSILDRMARAFRGSDVTLHAIDIAGVRAETSAQSGASRASNEGLYLLANSTGGTVFKNTNDLSSDFARFAKQQEVVYILGFQAPASQPGKFHNLKVRVVNAPAAKVVHRAGYYEVGGETAVERTLTNAEIMLNDIAQDAIRVAALSAAFPTSGKNAQVPVILEIAGGDVIGAARGAGTVTIEMLIYAFDEAGLVRDSLVQRMTLDLAKVGEQLRGSGIKYYGTLSLAEGTYAIRSLVRAAESDQKGFARVDVSVPKAGDVAISQPFVFEQGVRWLMVKGGSHDTTGAPYPFEIDGQPFVPRAGVRLKPGETSRFAVFVSNATPEELSWEVNPPAKIVSQFRNAKGAKALFELESSGTPLSAIEVTAKKKGTGEERKSRTPVVVP